MFCLSNRILNFGSLCIKVLSSPNIHVTYTRTSNPTRNACWITRIGALLFALFSAFPYVCFAGQLISIWRGLIISLEFLLPQVWYPSHCPSCGRGLPPTGWSRVSWAAAWLVSKWFFYKLYFFVLVWAFKGQILSEWIFLAIKKSDKFLP